MSLFLFVLLLSKKDKTLSDKYLLSIFSVYALTICGAYIEIYNHVNDLLLPHLMNISWLFLLLHGPLLWLYVNSLISQRFKFKAKELIHFSPFLFFFIFHLFDFMILPAQEKILIMRNELFRDFFLYKISVPAIGISSLTYNVWALVLLKKHLRNIKNRYSNIEYIDLKWLKGLAIASLIIFSVNVLLYNLNDILNFSGYYELSVIAYVFASIYVLYIGYFGIRQGRVFTGYQIDDLETDIEKETKTKENLNQNKENNEIIEKLTSLMELQQPYLDPELTLAKLSSMMQVRPEIISGILNNTFNQNFFDFINSHRIEEFKIRCLNKENKHLSIMGIAYECGFNSKAAFYRAFNKFEGTSPTTYISTTS